MIETENTEHKGVKSADEAMVEVKWGPLAAILVTVGAFFTAQIIGGVLLIIYMLLIGGESLDSLRSDGGVFSQYEYVFFGNLMVSATIIFLIRLFIKSRGSSLRSIGLSRPRLGKDLSIALAGYGIYFLAFLVLSLVINATAPELLEGEQELGFSKSLTGLALVPVFISLVIMPPLAEEILCRGFLFSGLRTKLPFIWAAVTVSVLFSAAHLNGGKPGIMLWVVAIDTFVLSIVLCNLRERTGRLWAPIFVHGLKNFIAFSVLYLV